MNEWEETRTPPQPSGGVKRKSGRHSGRECVGRRGTVGVNLWEAFQHNCLFSYSNKRLFILPSVTSGRFIGKSVRKWTAVPGKFFHRRALFYSNSTGKTIQLKDTQNSERKKKQCQWKAHNKQFSHIIKIIKTIRHSTRVDFSPPTLGNKENKHVTPNVTLLYWILKKKCFQSDLLTGSRYGPSCCQATLFQASDRVNLGLFKHAMN